MPSSNNIDTYLNNIMSARYGEEVRQSIHDAIAQVYTDAAKNPIVSGSLPILSADVIESLPFTDANLAPVNSIWNINNNIEEGMISNLPTYGTYGVLMSYCGYVDVDRYGIVQIFISGYESLWIRLKVNEGWTKWYCLTASVANSNVLDYLFPNEFDPSTATKGKTINSLTGVEREHYRYFLSDYISMMNGGFVISGFAGADLETYTLSFNVSITLYRADKTFIRGVQISKEWVIERNGVLVLSDNSLMGGLSDVAYIRITAPLEFLYTLNLKRYAKSNDLLNIEQEIVTSSLKASAINYANQLNWDKVSQATQENNDWTVQSGGFAFSYILLSNLPEVFYIRVKSTAKYMNYGVRYLDPNSTLVLYSMRKSGDYYYAKIVKSELIYENSEGNYLQIRCDMRNTEEGETATFSDIVISEGILIASDEATQVVAKVGYVSTSGNDDNNGLSETTALATVNKALELGFETIYISGGIYNQRIDVSKAQNKAIKLRNLSMNEKVIFSPSDCVLATTEEKVSGYTKVYRKEVEASFNVNNKWLFQDNISDATTEISDEERHPLQRGKAYRCDDTKIEKTTATDLTSALLEIESSDSYKWYYDTTTGTLYFSRPAIVTESNPIMMSKGEGLFYNADRDIELECIAINTKYYSFDVSNFARADVLDCKASNAYGAGCFRYDRNKEVKFLRCEAEHAFHGGTGDGFNGHSDSTGDPYAKQTDCSLIDCWSHDNNDDGYSDHERSEITIIGGLYEYNGKGGITPSYGSHCTCYNVYSRKNYSGFNYVGEATTEEGGEDGQMICYGCVAENNTLGSPYAGFRVSEGSNSMILVGCKSIGNTYGYIAQLATNRATLIDCGSLNDGTIKSGNGVFNIKNTTLVS